MPVLASPRPAAACRRGRVPLWIVLTILCLAALWLSEVLARDARAAGMGEIDTSRVRFEPAAGPGEARWERELAQWLALHPNVRADDREGLLSLAAHAARLPFVAQVGEPRVIWPDGLDLPLRLRRPVACVRSGHAFLTLSADGVLLPGDFSAPPLTEGRYLPVIGPNDGAFDAARPGERLAEPRHLDALSVAVSMLEHLSAADFELLGPPLIDASQAREASVEEPGVRLMLEGRRSVWFGRAPDCGQPGELPAQAKWAALRRALAHLAPGPRARDWALVDVRWDTPDVRWREIAPEGAPGGR